MGTFKIGNYEIRDGKSYLQFPRSKVTTTIRSQYLEEFQKLMKSLNRDYCKGYDILIEMLGENEEFLEEFIERVRKY